jgi:hypothetical protein
MHLLYIDDSGVVFDKNCRFCVLAGFSIYETQTYWIEKAINDITAKFFPAFPNIELHGTDMRSGKNEWRHLPSQVREAAMLELLNLVKTSFPKINLFGAVIDKTAASGIDISEYLFTQVASRFDMFLGRIFKNKGTHERGIAIFDKSVTELTIQKWSHTFQAIGHQWGSRLHNFAEVPLFLDSKMSRLIQLADLIAYAIYRNYEAGDNTYFSVIENCFDQEGGVVHGFHAKTR